MAMGQHGAWAVAAAMTLCGAAHAGSSTNLYTFGTGGNGDAANPSAALVQDSAGNLYGPAAAGGASTVGALFELSPPAAGETAWSESVIHSFPNGVNDGVRPLGRLLLGPGGVIFGTTNGGGGTSGDGTVFELSPASGGGWTQTTLYVFPQNKVGLGGAPNTGVIMDSAGALYGTTPEQGSTNIKDVVPGMVYKLTPPAAGQTAWTYSTLYSFPVRKGHTATPVSAPVADSGGNLYGSVEFASTTSSVGEIYEVSAGGAEQTVLTLPGGYGTPIGDLAMDAGGAIYGATTGGNGNGIVFRATPGAAGAKWTLSVLYVFGGTGTAAPVGGVTFGSGGALYGNATGGRGKTAAGITYRLTPPAGGTGRWTYTALAQFTTKPTTSGRYPTGAPTVGSSGAVYGVTAAGGTDGAGVAFSAGP